MDYKMIAFGIASMVITGIMLNLPIVFAADVTVSIFGGSFPESATINPSKEVSLTMLAHNGNNSITVSISNASAQSAISDILIYKCQELDPAQCAVTVSPTSFPGATSVSFDWNTLVDTSSYPQTGYLMILVKVSGANAKWNGFFYKLFKYDHNGFDDSTISNQNIATVEIYAAAANVAKVKDFININNIIPFNSDWVNSVIFSGVGGYFEISSNNPPSSWRNEDNQTDTMTEIKDDYSFSFPQTGGEFYNAISFMNNPSYQCGNGITDPGEDVSNCCYDVGCPIGQYCDNGINFCRNTNAISLDLSGLQSTGITNCNQPHTIPIYLKLNNAPNGAITTSQSYKLGNQPKTTVAASCSFDGSKYTCIITVPSAGSACTGQNYVLGPNKMFFEISYSDGPDTLTLELERTFPDIAVGSWTCDLSGCQSALGEDQSNCCIDCPCSGTNSYCDYQSGNLSSQRCMTDLTNNNLQVSNVNPSNFYTHQTGDSFTFNAMITSKPRGLFTNQITESCTLGCIKGDSEPCTATCSISCSPESSDDQNTYNSTCTFGFEISSYNSTVRYVLIPKILMDVRYNNGTTQLNEVIENEFANIIIDTHWCGDGVPNPDETYVDCCYDVACPAGQYCDSSQTSFNRLDDTCTQIGLIGLSIIDRGGTHFVDHIFTHVTNVTVEATNLPSQSSLYPVCSLGNGNLMCLTTCSDFDGSNRAICNISIPSINYNTSPYYSPVTKLITVPGNHINISIDFMNGSTVATKTFPPISIDDIVITPEFHWANGYCEEELGETWENSCADCPCPDSTNYCYTGANLAGQCLSADGIDLILVGTTPERPECTIQFYQGDCMFIRPVEFKLRIPNAPDDLELISHSYKFDGTSYDITCFADPIDQNQEYTCSTVFPKIPGGDGGTTAKDINVLFAVRYNLNGVLTTKNITAEMPSFSLTRIKSQMVIDCESVIEDISGKETELESGEMQLYAFLGIALALSIYTCYMAAICEGVCYWWVIACGLSLALFGCIGGMLMSQLDGIKAEITQLKGEKQSLCASSSSRSMRNSLDSMATSGVDIVTIGMGIICAVGITIATWGAFQGLGAASAGAAAAEGTTLPASSVQPPQVYIA